MKASKILRLLTAVAGLFFVFRGFAVGTFIQASNRVDMVYDDTRGLLYISSGGDVLCYDLSSDTFLTPFHVGFSLKGMDLSPDGNTLAVADASSGGGSNWVHLIDLPTGVIREATVASVRLNSMLCSSGDGSTVGVAEGDETGGPVDRYSVSSHSVAQSLFDASYFLYEIAVNRNGTQLAVPTYAGCSTSLITTGTFATPIKSLQACERASFVSRCLDPRTVPVSILRERSTNKKDEP